MSGYHLSEIPKGIYGELSKIYEEVAELEDAISQGIRIMVLCELADIYGATEAFLESKGITVYYVTSQKIGAILSERLFHENMKPAIDKMQSDETLYLGALILFTCIDRIAMQYNIYNHDVKVMSDVTKRAFQSGART